MGSASHLGGMKRKGVLISLAGDRGSVWVGRDSVYAGVVMSSWSLASTYVSNLLRPCLVPEKFCKIFQIFRHIESLDTCIEY